MGIEKKSLAQRIGAVCVIILLINVLVPSTKLRILFSVFSVIFPIYFHFRYERHSNSKKVLGRRHIAVDSSGILLRENFIYGFLSIAGLALLAATFIEYLSPEWRQGAELSFFVGWYQLVLATSIFVALRLILKNKFNVPYTKGFKYFMFLYVCICSVGILFLAEILFRGL